MSRLVSAPCWAHPRLCGEHVYGFAQDITFKGSSPPVRGAQPCSWRRHQDHGLIPACAGSTDFAVFDFYLAGAHPRLCGEHLYTSDAPDDPRGVSNSVGGGA